MLREAAGGQDSHREGGQRQRARLQEHHPPQAGHQVCTVHIPPVLIVTELGILVFAVLECSSSSDFQAALMTIIIFLWPRHIKITQPSQIHKFTSEKMQKVAFFIT